MSNKIFARKLLKFCKKQENHNLDEKTKNFNVNYPQNILKQNFHQKYQKFYKKIENRQKCNKPFLKNKIKFLYLEKYHSSCDFSLALRSASDNGCTNVVVTSPSALPRATLLNTIVDESLTAPTDDGAAAIKCGGDGTASIDVITSPCC